VSAQPAPGVVLSEVELQRVAAAMQEAGVELAGELRSSLIAGGRSNLTFKLSDERAAWVMRTPPRVGRTPSAHDVAREFRVTAALGDTGVPVARAVVLSEDETLIGGPFAIEEFVDGRGVQTQDELDALDDAALEAVVDSLISTLAALHGVDHVAVGLERFGRPDGYAERQLRRWSGQWELVGQERLQGLAAEVIAALNERLPRQQATSIVHGDYRIDNTLLTRAERPEVAAVVDWELSTIGDPVADVAMMCAYRAPAFDLIVGEPAAWTSDRLPSPEELAERYGRLGGVDLVDFSAHQALAYFKVAVIAAGIADRTRVGAASGPGFDTAGEAVDPYLDLAPAALRTRTP
jgi:aminoglycoside phosphotransferase (APT) family kinase protein